MNDLNRKVAAIVAAPEMQDQFAKLSFRPLAGSSDTLRRLIDEGHRRWGPVIKEAGIRLD